MCGLAGYFAPRSSAPHDVDLDAMLTMQAHRGPDGRKSFTSQDRRFQAGFLRLAIIDLATADQPLVENDGAKVLVGNGEVYNYKALRKQYAEYPYKTNGDIESVLAAHQARGGDFVHDLNGMYGLALYERDVHRLTLVRDRLGIKPMYWATVGNSIIFASEIKPLLASGLIQAAIDEDAVANYLSHGYVPAPSTLFKGIFKLPPGHQLVMDADGKIEVSRYWHATPITDLPSAPNAVRDHMTSLLRDSVRLQLQSDFPVGALLSGGIDSGLLVALAAEESNHRLKTFTVRFEGSKVDESPLAAQVAQRYDTDHTLIDVPAGDVGSALPRLAWTAEEPLADAALLPNAIIEEVLGQHVTVALNGTGGDELFAGYGRYFPLPIEQRYGLLPASLRKGIESMLRTKAPMRAWQLSRTEMFKRDRGAYVHAHSTSFPQPILDLIESNLKVPTPAHSIALDSFDGVGQTAGLYADLCTYLPDDLMVLLDRTTMMHGVEGRVPFLDHRIVEAALAVPESIRTPGGQQKGLERAMAVPYLPESLLSAPKHGFASPVPAWMTAGLGAHAKTLLTRPQALARGWWTATGIERLYADPNRHAFRLYQLLMLELVILQFTEQPLSSTPPAASVEDYAHA